MEVPIDLLCSRWLLAAFPPDHAYPPFFGSDDAGKRLVFGTWETTVYALPV